jgi:hypothetical protein
VNLEAVIERDWRFNWEAMVARAWEAAIECVWKTWLSALRDALQSCDGVCLEMHLEPMIVRTWRP